MTLMSGHPLEQRLLGFLQYGNDLLPFYRRRVAGVADARFERAGSTLKSDENIRAKRVAAARLRTVIVRGILRICSLGPGSTTLPSTLMQS
jgi:hypothetical protein